jgi:hypothetical protein
VLYPHHTKFHRIIPLKDGKQLGSFLVPQTRGKKLIKKLLISTGLLPWFAPSFGVLASSGPKNCGLLERVTDDVGQRNGARYAIVEIRIQPWGGFLAFLQDMTRPNRQAVLKVALHPGAEELLDRAEGNVRKLGATLPTTRGSHILCSGNRDGYRYSLEERLDGSDGTQMVKKGYDQPRLLRLASELLSVWRRNTARLIPWNDESLMSVIAPSGMDLWQAVLGFKTMRIIAEMFQLLRNYLLGREGWVVACHGDYHLGNILFNPDSGEITGVIDWDSAQGAASPLLDAMTLAAAAKNLPLNFSDENAEGLSIHSLVRYLSDAVESVDDDSLAQVRSEYRLTESDTVMAMLHAFLLRRRSAYQSSRLAGHKWATALKIAVMEALRTKVRTNPGWSACSATS